MLASGYARIWPSLNCGFPIGSAENRIGQLANPPHFEQPVRVLLWVFSTLHLELLKGLLKRGHFGARFLTLSREPGADQSQKNGSAMAGGLPEPGGVQPRRGQRLGAAAAEAGGRQVPGDPGRPAPGAMPRFRGTAWSIRNCDLFTKNQVSTTLQSGTSTPGTTAVYHGYYNSKKK